MAQALREAGELQSLLQDGKALLNAVMENIPIGLTIAEVPSVNILRVSDAGANLIARSREQLENISVERHSEAYSVYHPTSGELAAPDELPLTRATLQGEIIRNEEWLLRADDGHELTILCNAGPINGPKGERIGGLIAWSDISDKKSLEQELRDLVTFRDQLVSELYHRIANHLQITLAITRSDARSAANVDQFADKVEQRLVALSRAYSSFRGAGEQVHAKTFLNGVCTPLETSDVGIVVETSDDAMIKAEIAPIIGIIVNEAICNAIKHAFTCGSEGGLIRVVLGSAENNLQLSVTDNGIGMTVERKTERQGHKLMTTLATSFKGRLEILSSPGQGTTISATWPNR